MGARLGVLLAICLFLGPTSAAGAEPPPPGSPLAPRSPANDDCLACHADPDSKRENGTSIAVNQSAFERSTHGALACVDCHGDLATVQEFPHPDKLAKVSCAPCHGGEAAKYHDSIHSWAKERAGLTAAAPACAECHGTHDIRGPADPAARVSRANIPATCGACHQGIVERYSRGVHGAALKAGNAKAPVCTDCHTAHAIERADNDAWRLAVTAECGTCHVESMRTYRDTFHGQVTTLGFVRVATCADCHGAHDIFPKADPRSKVSSAQRVTTCRQCHARANESFAQYDPHADRHDRARNPALYYAGRFMDGLLLAVFAFFGLHTALWFARGVRERRSNAQER